MTTPSLENTDDGTLTTPDSCSTSPVPCGVLQALQQPSALPHEMRIIKALVFRVFTTPAASTRPRPISFSMYHCTYPLSGPLLTECEHYYDADRLAIKYRMGFTESYENVPKDVISALASSNHKSEFLYDQIMPKYASSLCSTPFAVCVSQKPRSPDHESVRIIHERVPHGFGAYFEDNILKTC